jgi:hypothetical protein
MKVLRVREWANLFENNRTRELKRMEWVPMPNKHDGDGFTELLHHANGMSHFGAWALIVEVASKCDMRGTLLREGAVAHDAGSLARMTHGSEAVFEEAIPRLLKIGWLELFDTEAAASDNLAPSCGETAPRCGEVPMEGNGMERNGRREEPAAPRVGFDQVTPEYLKELKASPAYRHLEVEREAQLAENKSKIKYPGKPMTRTFLLSWLGNLGAPDPQPAAKAKAKERADAARTETTKREQAQWKRLYGIVEKLLAEGEDAVRAQVAGLSRDEQGMIQYCDDVANRGGMTDITLRNRIVKLVSSVEKARAA